MDVNADAEALSVYQSTAGYNLYGRLYVAPAAIWSSARNSALEDFAASRCPHAQVLLFGYFYIPPNKVTQLERSLVLEMKASLPLCEDS